MLRLPTVVSLALSLVLASCGGGGSATENVNAGYAALGTSDWAAAESEFNAALAQIGTDPSNPQFKRAKLGLMKAKAYTDPGKAVAETVAMAVAGEATEKDFAQVGGYLMEAGATSEAVDLMDKGLKDHFPDSADLAKLKDRLAAAAATDPKLAERLKGLGYM